MTVENYVKLACSAMDEKSAEDIKVIDLRKISSLADYFIIGSASNERLTKAISDNIDKVLSENGLEVRAREGEDSASWILLDYGDFIVHIFKNEERAFYNLERLWKDAPYVEVEDLR